MYLHESTQDEVREREGGKKKGMNGVREGERERGRGRRSGERRKGAKCISLGLPSSRGVWFIDNSYFFFLTIVHLLSSWLRSVSMY